MDTNAPSRDPEVFAIGRRRQFSASETRALLAEAERCKAGGEPGAFMRRKRIYSSMLSSWRKRLGAADRVALAPKRRGPKPDVAARQVLQLTRDNVRLRRKLERAELIIDAQRTTDCRLNNAIIGDRSHWSEAHAATQGFCGADRGAAPPGAAPAG